MRLLSGSQLVVSDFFSIEHVESNGPFTGISPPFGSLIVLVSEGLRSFSQISQIVDVETFKKVQEEQDHLSLTSTDVLSVG